jgi:hypothetical protein
MFDDSGEGRKGVAAPPQKGKEEEEKKKIGRMKEI